LKSTYEELIQEKQYWQEYTTGLEVALKEMTQQSTMYETLLEEEKQRSLKIENVLDTFRKRNYGLVKDLEDMIDISSMELTPSLSAMLMMMESSKQQQQSSSGGTPATSQKEMPSHHSSVNVKMVQHQVFDVYDRWEFLLQVTK
jgi:hypothetical protein